jgi:tetrapyrrole methylase family protein/MazG family protein
MDFQQISTVFSTLRIDAPSRLVPSRLVLLEAQTLQTAHVPPYPPDCPALVTGVSSPGLAAHLKQVLSEVYPLEHNLWVIAANRATGISLAGLDGTQSLSDSTCLYIPALAAGTSFESFAEIVAHLRAPNGCPWDREQTHESLRKHILEESYETLEAIDAGDFASMREEFGDLLLQVVLQAQIASEAGQFNVSQVLQGIHEKLVRRHPHVFGDIEAGGVGEVLSNWEKLKEKERGGRKEGKGLLDGIPSALPALGQAQEYQDRAARVGFDWPEIEGVLDKIVEEIGEIRQAENEAELAEEIGDLFFALVNLARWRKVDAESVLRGTNLKFKKRFAHIEQNARAHGRNVSDMTLEEMDALWDEGKQLGL